MEKPLIDIVLFNELCSKLNNNKIYEIDRPIITIDENIHSCKTKVYRDINHFIESVKNISDIHIYTLLTNYEYNVMLARMRNSRIKNMAYLKNTLGSRGNYIVTRCILIGKTE